MSVAIHHEPRRMNPGEFRRRVETRTAELLAERRQAALDRQVAEMRVHLDTLLAHDEKSVESVAAQHREDGGQWKAHNDLSDHSSLLAHLENEHGVVPSIATRTSTRTAMLVHGAVHSKPVR
jgi:hypothetical protein